MTLRDMFNAAMLVLGLAEVLAIAFVAGYTFAWVVLFIF